MTGFGRLHARDNDWEQTWEVRTVNSRLLEIKWRIPHYCRRLEGDWEKLVRTYLARGRVEASLDLRLLAQETASPSLDRAQALGMLDQLRLLAESQDRHYQPDFNQLLLVPFLWRDCTGELPLRLVQDLTEGLRLVLDDLCQARTREGEALRTDISARLDKMTELMERIQSLAHDLAPRRMESLREKVGALLKAHEKSVDEARLLQELAFLSDRLDVSEELTRLAEHLQEAGRILNNTSDPGRRLDFLFQECLREITTCGNKTQDAKVSRFVVEFKTELEKCREQVQNLE
jgi:uncharacterized protein (TIGR00255 family)